MLNGVSAKNVPDYFYFFFFFLISLQLESQGLGELSIRLKYEIKAHIHHVVVALADVISHQDQALGPRVLCLSLFMPRALMFIYKRSDSTLSKKATQNFTQSGLITLPIFQ